MTLIDDRDKFELGEAGNMAWEYQPQFEATVTAPIPTVTEPIPTEPVQYDAVRQDEIRIAREAVYQALINKSDAGII